MSSTMINTEVTNTEVYRRPGRFAAWPANFGMWAWDDEIVLLFTSGHLAPDATGFHAVAGREGFETVQMRSLDGGVSWAQEQFTGHQLSPHGLAVDEHLPREMKLPNLMTTEQISTEFVGMPAGLDLADPAVTVMAGRTDTGDGSISWLYASTDRCRTWQGPFRLPSFGLPGVAARTDVVRLGPRDLLLLLTASKPRGGEGQVIAVRSSDGGQHFELLGTVGDDVPGARVMSSTVRLPDGILVAACRCAGPRRPDKSNDQWLEVYQSADEGSSWHCVNARAAETGRGGNPPTLNLLEDGRIAMAYGYRDEPSGMHARVSTDNGVTWGTEMILRNDGGSHDLGYPRTVQRADGALVTAYYFNDSAESERYIAATIWRP